MDTPRLLFTVALAYRSSGCDCPHGSGHIGARLEGQFQPAPASCALDLSALALRFGDGSHGLLDALSLLIRAREAPDSARGKAIHIYM